jgi:DNA-binding NarL/FixJ family response regulator
VKRRSFAIDAVEAGYRLDGSEAQWFQRILDGLAPELARGFGTMAITYRVQGSRLALDRLIGSGCPAPFLAFTRAAYENVPPSVAGAIQSREGEFYAFSEFARRLPREQRTGYYSAFEALGFADALLVSHPDGAGGWLAFGAPAERPIRTVPRQRAVWRKVCAHLATALRLRRRLGSARAAIDAVLARGEPAGATHLWKELVAGRWSIVSHVRARRDRILLAHRNDPGAPDPRGLSPRERAIVDMVLTGASSKRVAYALGLAAPTVASHLSRALRKLNLADRMELLRLAGLAHETASCLTVGDEELGVLKLGAARNPPPLPLTAAEREVALLVGEGLDNAEIARRRRRSERTVANQIASIFDKLAIGSRAELVLRLSRIG